MKINSRSKYLYLLLSLSSLCLLMGLTTLLWWFIAPRLDDIYEILRPISLALLRLFFLILLIGVSTVMLTSIFEKNFLIVKFAVNLYNRIMYPITIFLGTICGVSRERIRESFVHVNNSFIKASRQQFRPEEILILLPHCLQNNECKIRLSNDIYNCERCGKCDIAGLLSIAENFKVSIAIANGGTLARRIVLKFRPKFIVAVACDRDLVSGIQDVFPLPVYGILNIRPEGPCFNTRVDLDKLSATLQKIIYEEKR
ncbi:MAG: DUF116 domain-containing protein [Candidatus Cloacimonetes bacterium]|nr:DUF116 domain-containing protein [Candidatus Cloacimonadota bacterium]